MPDLGSTSASLVSFRPLESQNPKLILITWHGRLIDRARNLSPRYRRRSDDGGEIFVSLPQMSFLCFRRRVKRRIQPRWNTHRAITSVNRARRGKPKRARQRDPTRGRRWREDDSRRKTGIWIQCTPPRFVILMALCSLFFAHFIRRDSSRFYRRNRG